MSILFNASNVNASNTMINKLTTAENKSPAQDKLLGEEDAPVQDKPLRESVQLALNHYFNHLEGHDPTNLYEMVIREVEISLLSSIMIYTKGNQSRAALLLGMSRSTLRKKLEQYPVTLNKECNKGGSQ